MSLAGEHRLCAQDLEDLDEEVHATVNSDVRIVDPVEPDELPLPEEVPWIHRLPFFLGGSTWKMLGPSTGSAGSSGNVRSIGLHFGHSR